MLLDELFYIHFLFLGLEIAYKLVLKIYLNVQALFVLLLVTFLIIRKGLDGISKVNSILVPVMLIFYVVLGGYVFINYYQDMGRIFGRMIQEAFIFSRLYTGTSFQDAAALSGFDGA